MRLKSGMSSGSGRSSGGEVKSVLGRGAVLPAAPVLLLSHACLETLCPAAWPRQELLTLEALLLLPLAYTLRDTFVRA